MAFGLTAGGAALLGAGVGLVGDIAGGSMDAENAAQARAQDRELVQWQTEADRQNQTWNAELGRNQYGVQVENDILNQRNQTTANMWGNKYGVENEQARYDAFRAEFGDVQDNVNNYFRTLSSSSIKAQNNEEINTRMQGVSTRLMQTMAERGITPASGIAIQAIGETMMQGETAKVEMNRNVDTEVAQTQQGFLSAQAQNPFLARPEDFKSGIMDTGERDTMISKDGLKTTYDIPKHAALPIMPAIESPEATGISGFLSSIF